MARAILLAAKSYRKASPGTCWHMFCWRFVPLHGTMGRQKALNPANQDGTKALWRIQTRTRRKQHRHRTLWQPWVTKSIRAISYTNWFHCLCLCFGNYVFFFSCSRNRCGKGFVKLIGHWTTRLRSSFPFFFFPGVRKMFCFSISVALRFTAATAVS